MDLDPLVLAGLRDGDASALEACYHRFGARVFRLCRGLLGQDSDAEDATQEVFLKVFERARQFTGAASFSTWLHRVTVNHCLHRLEREHLRRAGSLELAAGTPDTRPSPVERCSARDELRSLTARLDRLPPPQRTVLVLREVEGLSYAEIAQVLGLPAGTVMSRLARARENLLRLGSPAHALDHGASSSNGRAGTEPAEPRPASSKRSAP